MRKLISIALVTMLGIAAYAAWPVVSAFQIKQAIKAGDVATLERKVHWAPVRASLKASLATLAPNTASSSADQSGSRAPSLWSRVKAATAPYFADRLIDTYVTAEGVTKLNKLKHSGFLSVIHLAPPPEVVAPAVPSEASPAGANADPDEVGSAFSRFLAFYDRIASARFYSLTIAEFEIIDRTNPARRFISQFHLSDFDWKLASVRIVGQGF